MGIFGSLIKNARAGAEKAFGERVLSWAKPKVEAAATQVAQAVSSSSLTGKILKGVGLVALAGTLQAGWHLFSEPDLGMTLDKVVAPIQRAGSVFELISGDDGMSPNASYSVYLANRHPNYKAKIVGAYLEFGRHAQALVTDPQDVLNPQYAPATTDEIAAGEFFYKQARQIAEATAAAAGAAAKQRTEQLDLNSKQASLAPLARGAFDFNRSSPAGGAAATQFVADGAQVTGIIDRMVRTSSYYGPISDATALQIKNAYMAATGGKLEPGETMGPHNRLTSSEAVQFARSLHDVLMADRKIDSEHRGKIERGFSFSVK